MLRNIQDIIETPEGKFKIRLKCGHILSNHLVKRPAENGVYNCDKCDIKGQGASKIVGYLNNGYRRRNP